MSTPLLPLNSHGLQGSEPNPATIAQEFNMPFTGYGQSDGSCSECIPTQCCYRHDDRPVYPGHRNDGPVDLSKLGTPTGRGTFYFGRPRNFPKIESLSREAIDEAEKQGKSVNPDSQSSEYIPSLKNGRWSSEEKEQAMGRALTREFVIGNVFDATISMASQSFHSLRQSMLSLSRSPSPGSMDSDRNAVYEPQSATANTALNKICQPLDSEHNTTTQVPDSIPKDSVILHAKLIASGFHLPPLKINDTTIGVTPLDRPSSEENKENEQKTCLGKSHITESSEAATHFLSILESRLSSVAVDGAEEVEGSVAETAKRSSNSSHLTARNSALVTGSSVGPNLDRGGSTTEVLAYMNDMEEVQSAVSKKSVVENEATESISDCQGPQFSSSMTKDYPYIV